MAPLPAPRFKLVYKKLTTHISSTFDVLSASPRVYFRPLNASYIVRLVMDFCDLRFFSELSTSRIKRFPAVAIIAAVSSQLCTCVTNMGLLLNCAGTQETGVMISAAFQLLLLLRERL